ncbi:MAG: DNA primase [Candidatus Liptonbacteria bacterium]|nr:DNA primase [Candidatus Liptonbacteria bacterium]
MEDNVSKIKDKLDIVDVISGYLKLTKSGINYKARCPFHNEKTPSFFISPERQIWHCFGCAKGGDMFGFIQEVEGVEFPEALRTLAQKAGVTLEYSSGNFPAKDGKAVLYEVCETSARFFEKQLYQSGAGKRALEYLKNRGLTDETMKEFRLGFAPSDWESLSVFLRNYGHKDGEIVDAGLAIKRDGSNGIYDRFRSRIVFPIADLNGQVVGFTGRVFAESVEALAKEEGQAKYINTPQTAIYDKSRILYGLHKAKTEIRREDKCVMVEGNMDALMSYQAGVKNVVATSGTALTPSHLKIIQRYTANLGLCFDTDQAGAMATRRGIGLALADGLNVKVVEIEDKECKDPADYVRKYGAGWLDIVNKAKPVIEFYFDKAKEGFDPNSAESKKTVISALAPFVKRLTSQVERAHWLSQLAFFLRTKEDAIEADIDVAKDDLAAYESQQHPKAEKAEVKTASLPPDLLSETLLSLIIKSPDLFKEEFKNINPDWLDAYTAKIVAGLAANPDNFGELVKEFREKDQSYKLDFAHLKAQEFWKDFKDDDLKSEFQNLINKIKKRAISAQLSGLAYDIKDAEAKKDRDKVKELSVKFVELINQYPKNV